VRMELSCSPNAWVRVTILSLNSFWHARWDHTEVKIKVKRCSYWFICIRDSVHKVYQYRPKLKNSPPWCQCITFLARPVGHTEVKIKVKRCSCWFICIRDSVHKVYQYKTQAQEFPTLVPVYNISGMPSGTKSYF
jgi:hypothetical protein